MKQWAKVEENQWFLFILLLNWNKEYCRFHCMLCKVYEKYLEQCVFSKKTKNTEIQETFPNDSKMWYRKEVQNSILPLNVHLNSNALFISSLSQMILYINQNVLYITTNFLAMNCKITWKSYLPTWLESLSHSFFTFTGKYFFVFLFSFSVILLAIFLSFHKNDKCKSRE